MPATCLKAGTKAYWLGSDGNKYSKSGDTYTLIEDESKGIYHVCEIDGKTVGQIMYTYEWSDWRNGTFLWVQSVYVNKENRGRGVFKALYNYIKDMCDKDESICGIRLYVERENYVAQKTYSNLGMHECNYHMYEYEK